MVVKTFAPVLIPTLNRHVHLKRCIESLERCSGAENTVVYVALDYPPSVNYVEGWKKNDAYLAEKEKNNCFKSLIVERRQHNYGVGKVDGNYEMMLKEIEKEYDRFIFTEDDNEFAPNFLEYINWGLEAFKDDESIYAICGFKDIYTDDIKNSAYILNTIFSAWGYGTWFSKRSKVDKLDYFDLKNRVDSMPIWDAFRSKVTTTSSLLSQIVTASYHGDVLVSLLPKDEKWCVFPKLNKVRNWGWDGTGTHGGSPASFRKYSTVPIDKADIYEPVIEEGLYNEVIMERFRKRYKKPFLSVLRASLTFLLYKLTGFIPMANKGSKWCKVKLLRVEDSAALQK